MITTAETSSVSTAAATSVPTIWGLDPTQLHDRFWAARGVQVVRQGQPSQIVKHAELFLLTDPQSLVIFKIGNLVEQLCWLKPQLLSIRLHDTRERGYRELVVTDAQGRFVRFNRVYGASDFRMARVALTADRRVAEAWQSGPEPNTGWRQLRRRTPRSRRLYASVDGNVYDRSSPQELMQFLRDLMQVWKSPDATIQRAQPISPNVWADIDTRQNEAVKFIGPAWVGAGRQQLAESSIIGPVVLWDDPEHRPVAADVQWQEIEPRPVFDRPVRVRKASSLYTMSKRLFDIGFAVVALMLTLPVYPIVIFFIWIEDGRPIFFKHKRETIGGEEFDCIKFRSMRNNSEVVKAQLMAQNKADGPQFFLDPDNDPRLTRIGKLLRKTNVDELPQFFNVLMGHMSVVGPRPSPRAENQCCPPWREARLSVRPGISGLWQVMRTRQVGQDFQEWIKYDIEYVERASWKLDLWIIYRTLLVLTKLSD
jgi:lipopolysaccharide/colanic/teichoic acid biosynthesis glycosyltransferase